MFFSPPFFDEFHKRATAGSVASFRRRAVFIPRTRRAVGRRRSYRERDTSRVNSDFLLVVHDREVRNKRYRSGKKYRKEYISFVSRIELKTIIFEF